MPSPKVGQVINNKYRLLRHIGDGGMGSVYEARHETLGTTVALKFLHLEFARREGLVQRFLQEARASARIQSPHVIRVSDVDQTSDGDVFIVMEYLEGQTLQALYEELYRTGRKLPYADALDYAEQMLDGVHAAHEAGIIHRDLKPDNVMVTIDAKGTTVLKLLDFGIAKLKAIGGPALESAREPSLTRPGVMMGTPEYMAPEQATSADAVDARADIFALGVIIFEMLAGQRPVGGDNPLELAAAYRDGKISKLADLVPGVAPELATAVHKALSANASGRFASTADMRDAIAPFAAAVRPPSPSRLRAGGTIGVNAPANAEDGSGVHKLPKPPSGPIPPPTAESKPLGAGVAKTWPPDEAPPKTVGGRPSADPPRGFGTVVDDPVSAAQEPDRTHRIGEPYAPLPGSAAPPIAQAATSPASRPFVEAGPGTLRGAPPTSPRRPKRASMSVAGMLATAASIAAVVTGVAYLASRSSSVKDDEPTGPLSTSGPPNAQQGPAQPQDQPPPDRPPSIPAQVPPRGGRTFPAGPRPAPKAGPSPAPSGAPSAQPAAPPSAPPPAAEPPPPQLVLPSALPFPNPFDQP